MNAVVLLTSAGVAHAATGLEGTRLEFRDGRGRLAGEGLQPSSWHMKKDVISPPRFTNTCF